MAANAPHLTIDPFGLIDGSVEPHVMTADEIAELEARDRQRAEDALEREARRLRPCPRCSGRGHFDAYAHIDGGRCFRCGGTGIDPR